MTTRIASIYFEPLSADRPLYQGRFNIPAVPKGEPPFILEVRDHFQYDDEPFFKGVVNGRQIKRRTMVLGEEIANCLLREWTASHPDMNPQQHPGVWIVREIVPLTNGDGSMQFDAEGRQAYRPATTEEKAAMFAEDLTAAREIQAAWGEACIMKGDVMAEDVKKIAFIPPYCKSAARYYGRDRKWLYALKDGDIKKCPWCEQTISATAAVCPQCGNVANPERYAALQQKQQQVMDGAAKGVVRPPVGKGGQSAAA